MGFDFLNIFKKDVPEVIPDSKTFEPADEEYAEPEGELICQSESNIIFVAHKGLINRKNPANSKTAFFRAGKLGMGGLECDMWESAHNEDDNFMLVLSKDQNLAETFGVNKDITGLTPEEIADLPPMITKADNAPAQGLCTFRKFLVVCSLYRMIPFINLRMGSYSRKALRMIFKELSITGTLNTAVFISSKPRALFEIRKYARRRSIAGPKYILTLNNEGLNERFGEDILAQAEYAHKHNFDGIRVNRKCMNGALYKYCTQNDMLIDLLLYKKTDQDNLKNDIKEYPAVYSVELKLRL